MVSIGTVVWLSSELMFFAALFAIYFTLRSVATAWPPEDVHLNIALTLPNAILLIASSFVCQVGVFAAERGDVHKLRRWFTATLIMGTIFVMVQLYEYFELIREGVTISTHSYGSAFYLLTGFHGLHVTGGLVAFVLILARTYAGRFTPEKATSAIVVSYYWHFVDVVWIALYTTVYLIQ
ncbi:MAG: cytochrome c oxidase subunit 3 [Mycobacterium leprae]